MQIRTVRHCALLSLALAGILLAGCQTSSQYTRNAASLTENHSRAARMQAAVQYYEQIQNTPWSALHLASTPLRPGMQDAAIPAIRSRLALLGDLDKQAANRSTLLDPELSQAIRRFQWRHGLKPDGMLGAKTLEALNVSPKQRLLQLEDSAHKWAQFPKGVGARYIRVNVASFKLDLIENGKKVIKMRIIAGKPSRPTPELYSKVETLVLNPQWNIPKKIIAQDIIPKILENPAYLEQQRINIYSNWEKSAQKIDPRSIDWKNVDPNHFPYRMSQDPGVNNALGQVKFVFMNNDDIYLHDTPQKGLFAQIQRAFSSGCIRLEKPFQLVEYFVANSQTLNNEALYTKLASGKTEYIRIKNPIPIYITYITAWVDKKGVSHFREDIYKRQQAEASAWPSADDYAQKPQL